MKRFTLGITALTILSLYFIYHDGKNPSDLAKNEIIKHDHASHTHQHDHSRKDHNPSIKESKVNKLSKLATKHKAQFSKDYQVEVKELHSTKDGSTVLTKMTSPDGRKSSYMAYIDKFGTIKRTWGRTLHESPLSHQH